MLPTSIRAQSGCDRTVDNTPIQTGIDSLGSGQTLCVKSGIYRERINLNKEGITVKNFPGHTPILDGGYNRGLVTSGNGNRGRVPQPTNYIPGGDGKQGMVVLNSDGVTFDGFVVQNIAGRGAIMRGKNQTVQNNKFYWIYSQAIMTNEPQASEENKPRNLNILNNTILFPTVQNLDRLFNPSGEPDSTTSAIKIGNCRGPIRIAGNYAAFSYGEGFDIGKGCKGTAAEPIIVENNTIHDTNHVKFYAVHPRYVHFRNNIAFDTNQATIYSDGTPPDAYRSTNEVAGDGLGPANNIYFYNNIAYNTDTAIALEDRGESGSNIYVGFNTFVSGPQTRDLSKFNETGNGIVENNIFHYSRRKQMGGTNSQGQNIATGAPGNYTFRANFWTHQPNKPWAISTTDKIGDPQLVDYDFDVTLSNFPSLGYASDQYLNYSNVNFTTNFTVNNYKLTSQSSQSINQAALRQAFSGFLPPEMPFTRDLLGNTRTNPDIGAIEYDGSPAPSSSPSPTDIPEDTTIDVDVNNDGKVNIQDYNVIVDNFNSPYTIVHYNELIAQFNP